MIGDKREREEERERRREGEIENTTKKEASVFYHLIS